MIDSQTKLYLSFSARPGNFGATVFNALFQQHKINAVYLPRHAKDAKSTIDAFRTLEVQGCAISSPLKTEIIQHLDSLDAVAEQTQSVNTVVRQGDKLHGFNTDLFGVQKALEALKFESALVYGAGSVVNSVIAALKARGCSNISVAARRKDQAEAMAAKHGVKAGASEFDLLINATPASLDLNSGAELFGLCLKAKSVFDLVVSPQKTPLISKARSLNLKTVAGIDMAKWQLQKQFELYTGVSPLFSEIDAIVASRYA